MAQPRDTHHSQAAEEELTRNPADALGGHAEGVRLRLLDDDCQSDPENGCRLHLWDQVWYNRHCNLRIRIQRGRTKVVTDTEESGSPGAETITDEVWKLAREAAKRVEERRGKRNLGPWDDFEWGMINGKLSALRWVLGDEWDMLDT